MNLIFDKQYGIYFVYDQDDYDGAPDTPASGRVMGSGTTRYEALLDFSQQMVEFEGSEVPA